MTLLLDRLGFYGVPVAATALLHLAIAAFLLVRMPDAANTVIAAAPKLAIIQAALVDAQSLRPAPKPDRRPVRPTPSPADRPEVSDVPKPQIDPEPTVTIDEAEPETSAEVEPTPEDAPMTPEEILIQALADIEVAIDTEPEPLSGGSAGDPRDAVAALIQRAVISRWTRPPSARNGMVAVLTLQLVPTGDVVSVHVTESSGNVAFDRSAMTAVERVGRFPEVQQLERAVFERDFRRFQLLFRPEDLRY